MSLTVLPSLLPWLALGNIAVFIMGIALWQPFMMKTALVPWIGLLTFKGAEELGGACFNTLSAVILIVAAIHCKQGEYRLLGIEWALTWAALSLTAGTGHLAGFLYSGHLPAQIAKVVSYTFWYTFQALAAATMITAIIMAAQFPQKKYGDKPAG